VFLADNSPNSARPFKSFTGLYQSILSTKYEQPWWGGNYISFSLIPTPDGGLAGGAGAVVKCELRVDGGGLFQFCSAFQNEIERARQRKLDANTLRKLGFVPAWIFLTYSA
jgi:WW domain-binding protein 2